jgi:phosphatidate cytidylyltransferase
MEKAVNRIAGCFSVMIYPGLFMYWLVRMNIWENSGAVILFLLITFGNDSTAWLTGTLFGKNNRKIIPASPNKSIAGFLGGFLGTVIISLGAAYLFPEIFSAGANAAVVSGLLVKAAILGLCTGIFATLGDLCESAIKRSCGFVDSGKVILGRGGVLDSIDSIAIAAPVYFLLFSLFFTIF